MPLIDELESLETAEDFLSFFGIETDPALVRVVRLHILQRFHDELESQGGLAGLTDDDGGFECAKTAMERAYIAATASVPEAKRVFKIHRLEAERQAAVFVPLTAIGGMSSS